MVLKLANGHVSALFRPMVVMILRRRAKRLVSEALVACEGYAQSSCPYRMNWIVIGINGGHNYVN